ncbi:TIGR04283 family arsenosugar biosynthesis glycosyltransferase [uncultured Desulfobacter sp.]|uniref:TIGR04283 family arsenosugar biosynthesis glycosyltransferase n=1 Tax=uncultured Desulfobacter sp. TaxID=240139 RepID=UPI0029C8FE1F|nr:TIGR04283 family arsenosugar biosynthesis glycosyltransferase [uncultured Desulfobacter sp.]
MSPLISVIIPVYCESNGINLTIDRIKSSASASGMISLTEIIVVDGDPGKSTLKVINDPDIIKKASPAGRGVQMNNGARAATADVLLFLHADTILPANAFNKILDVCRDKDIVAGAFDLVIDAPHPGFRLIEKTASLRSRITRIPFGDQAIFIKADCFQRLGGYKPIALMEDVDIMLRIRQRGHRIRFISNPVVTSARRWKKEGMIYTTIRNWILQLLFYTGVSPEKLKNYYHSL